MTVIDDFTGENGWLSNFHTGDPFVLDGITYPSGEHAFHAQKSHDLAFRTQIAAAATPSLAKKMGRAVALRPDWENVKRRVMADVVAARFTSPALHRRLLDTDDDLLIEGNRHHDQVWGDCVCEKHFPWPGQNWLGKALMAERAKDDATPGFSRVAVTGHRPQSMTNPQTIWAFGELIRLAQKLKDDHRTTTAISGMALGADSMWHQAARIAGLDLWAYIPFEDQANGFTPSERAEWADYRAFASRELVLGQTYDVRLFHARNEYMIRDADLTICVTDPAKTSGGTYETMKKIRAQGLAHVIVDIAALKTTIVKAVSV